MGILPSSSSKSVDFEDETAPNVVGGMKKPAPAKGAGV